MRFIFAFVVLVAVAFAADTVYEEFVAWSQAHGKHYLNSQEQSIRFANFRANRALVHHFNRQGHAQFELNKFADMSQEEFAEIYLRPFPSTHAKSTHSLKSRGNYPEEWNWFEKGLVGPVKDQKSCGSCWAFSSTGNIEGVFAVKKGDIGDHLSEQQLVDCEHDCMIFPGTTEKVCDAGCNGGLMPNAFTYAIREGLTTDKEYSYTARAQTCTADKHKENRLKPSNWTFIDELDIKTEANITKYLNEMGPLAVAVDATYWSYYKGGIYDDSCSSTRMNHAVLLVGYGFEGNNKYWIIQNSWGTSWGEKGFIRLIRGKNKCGVNNFVCTVLF